MTPVLVVGGAGYIGSATAALLATRGYDVTVLDNLDRGHAAAVPSGVNFVQADVRDGEMLANVLGAIVPECVLHFAALAYVGESFDRSADYFDVNVGGTASLLAAMADADVGRLVFSSSCTVYGIPDSVPISEDAWVKPAESPYGETKQMCETMIRWQARTAGLSFAALRYFNAAGAWGIHGEDHRPETHLIPLVIDAAMQGARSASMEGGVKIFGKDYPTEDGTCVRDYVHIRDLAMAHVAACEKLLNADAGTGLTVNLGSGKGSSILDVIRAVERLSGRKVPHEFAQRREGDPPELVAANGKAADLLGWKPQHSSLDEVVRTAWEWCEKHPSGYPA